MANNKSAKKRIQIAERNRLINISYKSTVRTLSKKTLENCEIYKKEAIQELKRISNRTNSENNNKINAIVEEILKEVKTYGDLAVEKYTKKFDGFHPKPMKVSSDDLKDAWEELDLNLKSSLEVAYKRIKKFHEKEIPTSFTIEGEHGDTVQRRGKPVKNAGIYIPGGRAAYPSTVLKNAIPATEARV